MRLTPGRARVLVLVLGGWRLLGVLGIANGAAVVFLFVFASLTILLLIELVLPSTTAAIRRRRRAVGAVSWYLRVP